MYSLFICGTPHNKKGFEFTVLEGNKVPDGIFQYIDIYNPDKMRDGNTYVIQKINILKKDYILLSKYVGINPSDQRTSRGAYIAAGVLVESPVSLSSSIMFLSKITNLHTSLKMMRDERNAFKTTFDISKDLQNIEIKCADVAFLANLTYSISNLNETKKVIFNDIAHSESIKDIDDNLISNELDNQKKLIIKYQEELEDEKEAYRLTRVELENEMNELKNKIEYLKNDLSLASQNTYAINDTQEDYLTLSDKSMPHNHSIPQSTNKVSHQHKRHAPISRRSSSYSNHNLNQADKKRLTLTGTFLRLLIVLLLIIVVYFTFDYFTGTSATGLIESSSSPAENTVELISETPEDSAKEEMVVAKESNAEEVVVIEVDASDIKQEAEETPSINKKSPTTLEKLKDLERN
ncbi:MAG TPA: hypothetical protein EYG73_13455 [Arcobacter sp.]|nr:hypothetical protein [Arcobacter sp.]